MPQAKSVFENPDLNIDGFLLDTTWKVLPFYVVSILTACFRNTSVPICYSFGNSENKKLYGLLLKTIEQKFQITFRGKVVESDQGTSLKSLTKEWGFVHLMCLRHLLNGIKNINFFYEIKMLVKSATQFEFDNCRTTFSETFSKLCENDQNAYEKINNSLKKVGLVFHDNKIEIGDEARWDQVSILKRIQYRMPSTTNSLEATHGHLNRRTPRRNNFFAAIFRLYNEFNLKYEQVESRIKHNYSFIKRKTKLKPIRYGFTQSISLCDHYKTDIKNCLCSDNKLESANFRIDIPCFHRLLFGAEFEKVPQMSFNFPKFFTTFIFEDQIIPNEKSTKKKEYNDIEYVSNLVKRFTRYKNIEGIQNYVSSHFKNKTGFYIHNQDVAIVQIIEEAIYHFKNPDQQTI